MASDQKKEKLTREDKNALRLAKMRATLDNLEQKATAIMEKGESMTSADKIELLRIVNVAYHSSGKIETISSIDSSASCEFCSKMRKAAEDNLLMICRYCYAAADFWKEAANRRHKLNARILSTILFTEDELKTLEIPTIYARINEDGDIINAVHAQNIIRIIKTHKNVFFGFWYKNVVAVENGLKSEGITTREQRPENVRFIQSSLMIGFPSVPAWFTDAVFTVFPNEETTLNAIKCGAFPCNGRKCKDCKYNCYDTSKNSDNVQQIAELLRCSATMREKIMSAYHVPGKE